MPPPMPTRVRWPSERATAAPKRKVSSTPTKSSTTSAPTPPSTVAPARWRRRPSARSRCAHRRRAASSSASGIASTAMTRAGESAPRIWIAMWPRPPAPITTAVEPGTSSGSDRLIAWYGVSAASVSGAASTGIEVAERHEVRARRARPCTRPSRRRCRARRPRRRARPGARSSSPAPARSGGTPRSPTGRTRRPGRRPRTPDAPGPSASTQPAFSWPSVNGGPQGRRPPSKSYMRCRSEWHAPAPPMRTRTSPGPGSGSATSASSGPCFQSTSRNARMGSSPRSLVRTSRSSGTRPRRRARGLGPRSSVAPSRTGRSALVATTPAADTGRHARRSKQRSERHEGERR